LIERGVGVLVEPSLIPVDDVGCFVITGADLAKKGVVHIQTYATGNMASAKPSLATSSAE
jgi:hypothetical protein